MSKNGKNGHANGDHLNGKELMAQAERASVTSTIWDLRRQGMDLIDISNSLGMPLPVVRKCIEESYVEWRENIQGATEQEITLDVARLNLLIKQNLPISQSIKVPVARKTVEGQAYTDDEYQYCLAAGKLVIDAIKEKGKILNYSTGKAETATQNNFQIWMHATPSTEKVANAKPAELGSGVSDPDFLDLDFDP